MLCQSINKTIECTCPCAWGG